MAPGTLSNTMPDMRALLAGGIDARVCTMAAPPYGRMGFIKDEICRNVRTAEANMRLLACPLKACMNRFVLFPTSGSHSWVKSSAVRAPARRPSQYGKNRFCGGENTEIGSIFFAFHHDSIFCRCFGLQFNQANKITFIDGRRWIASLNRLTLRFFC